MMSNGEALEASLRGRMKRSSARRVLVGDRVKLEFHDDSSVTIEEICPRTSLLKRRNPGKKRGAREVAANVDQVLTVGAVADPPWDQQLMNRFIVVAEASDLPVTVVINKIDLQSEPEKLASVFRMVGYQVLLTSVTENVGIDELRHMLEGKISLLSGPTGVGKSSLLNAVQPGLRLRTAEVSGRTRSGRHTTVSAEMLPLDGGGFVVDTPGLRDIGLWGIDPDDVANAFPEIARASVNCRFGNCRHVAEPGCSVLAGCEDGTIDPHRVESYQKFLAEAERARRHWE